MVVARAKSSLAVPPSATVSLRRDTLVVGGAAPIDWLGRARAVAPPPGVAHLDYSAVAPTLPPRLDSLRQVVEAGRAFFAAGSSDLSASADAQLRTIASAFRGLSDDVTALGASVRLDLLGRTDPTGTDETNKALAQWRVDKVLGRLESLGIGAGLLTGHAVATTRPLPDADPAQRARINRSVSFEITLWTGPRVPRGEGR
jgi:outer membrane protein OmpA-like peptidoglycan-associated protein